MPHPLLNGTTADAYRAAVHKGADLVAARLAAVDAPLTGATPADLDPAIAAVDLDAPLPDVDAALEEVQRLYLDDATWFHHPRYLGHLNCPVAIPALLAETILAPVNSSLDTWDQSAGATLIEQRLVRWTAGRLGFDTAAADGVFTSGGSQSNLQALHIARDELGGDVRILVSEAGHFSVSRSAKLLGIDEVVAVPCDDRMRLRPDALDLDGRPAIVVATAGTTDFGSIDPLPEIADACAGRAWMHVDAAYGCGLLVSSTRRGLLDGIERADSVTADFHKAFFQPISSSALVVRDRRTLRHVTEHADYLNPAGAGVPNQVDKSLQTTRRFDALKLWLTLRVLGPEGVGRMFDAVCDLAAEAVALFDERFELAVDPTLSTLVFRVAGADDEAHVRARTALLASGDAFVATTRAGGQQWLKFTLLNPDTTLEDIAHVLDLIADHALVTA